MVEVPGREHRSAPRISRQFMMRYRPYEAEQEGWLVSPLRDLSATGARLLSERTLRVGDELEVQLILPASAHPIAVKAHVVWVKPWRFTIVEIGLQFDFLAVEARQAIEHAVSQSLGKPHP